MGPANPWDAEWEVSAERARRLIGGQFPSLSAKRVRELGSGWDNTVYAVGDDEYVFRFPRRNVAVELLKLEGKMLPKLADYVTLPYSKPLFVGEGDADGSAPFLGYAYLPGAFPLELTDEQRAQSAAVLAGFLRRLHAFPVQVALENGVPRDHRHLTDLAARAEKMRRFLADLKPHLRREEHDAIAGYLDRLWPERVRPREAFLHGDLHFKNMLVDENGRLSGIIDWGDMNVGHPACDLNVAYSFLPPQARPAFFAAYGEADEATRTLARLIAVYIPLLILLQAVDDRDETVAAAAKANIKRALAPD